MRLSPSQSAKILKDPVSASVILLHGDDIGLMRARSRQLARVVLQGEDDPFQLSILARHEHDALLSEGKAPSLTGGRRVVRVLDAGDHLIAALARLEEGRADALLILEGGVLSSKSKLRIAVEKHQRWASIICQPATSSTIAADLKKAAATAGCTISADIVPRLVEALPSDSDARASELEKLITYAGHNGVIDADAVLGCGSTACELSTPTLFSQVMRGDQEAADMSILQAQDRGMSGAGLIAAFGAYVSRLLKIQLLVGEGMTVEQAVGTLFPPLPSRQVANLTRELNGWPVHRLVQLLGRLREADQACKRALARDETIAAGLLLRTCCQKAARTG